MALKQINTGSGGGSVGDATPSAKGVVQLTNHLGGTATAPTVPGLAGKANTSHSHAQSDVTGLGTALTGKQAVDTDLTALSGIGSVTFGRSLLTLANQAALISQVRNSGTLSARPAANAVPSGFNYFATDDNGGTLYTSNGTTWAKISPGVAEPSGRRVGLAQITSNSNYTIPSGLAAGDGTVPLVLSGVTLDGVRPITMKLSAYGASINSTHIALINAAYKRTVDSTWIIPGAFTTWTSGISGQRVNVNSEMPLGVLTNESYDFKIQFQGNTVGEITTLFAASGAAGVGPATLRVVYE